MKSKQQEDLIDADALDGDLPFEYYGEDHSDGPNDAYVIGEHGNTVRAPDAGANLASRAGPGPWVKPMAFVLVVLCVSLTAWNVIHLLQGPPPPPKPSAFQIKQALYLGVMRIDAYRRIHGITPDSLADAGLSETGPYTYRRIDPSHYVISFDGNGPQLEYDSSEPKERFFGSPKEILTLGGPK